MHEWRRLDFFRPATGLLRENTTECEIAYDYELAVDCAPLVSRIQAHPDRAQRALAWVSSHPYISRWMLNLVPGAVLESPGTEPLVPTACLLTPWFPQPWLTGFKS
jgi:hypothetical protein